MLSVNVLPSATPKAGVKGTVNRLLPKVLNDNPVSAHEFDIILFEFEQNEFQRTKAEPS